MSKLNANFDIEKLTLIAIFEMWTSTLSSTQSIFAMRGQQLIEAL